MKGRLNISINDKMTTPEIGVRVIDRTCMVSRSWTYFRSVSTISRMMLFLAISWALAGCGRVSLRRLSQELLASREGDDAGGGSKASGGRWLTIAVTVLITYKATHVNKRANKERMTQLTLTKPSVDSRFQMSVTVKGSHSGIAWVTWGERTWIAKRAMACFFSRSGLISYVSGLYSEWLILGKPASAGSWSKM